MIKLGKFSFWWKLSTCIVQEDLWKAAFPVGTEVRIFEFFFWMNLCYVCLHFVFFCAWQWDQLDGVYQFNWNFSNLEVSCWCFFYLLFSHSFLVACLLLLFPLDSYEMCCKSWLDFYCSLSGQDAFEEGGKLYGKKVYLFGCTERK